MVAAVLPAMVGKTFSATHHGIEGVPIEVEVACQKAPSKILMTGLPGDVVKESRGRIRACLNNLGFDIPSTELLVHLSPASSKKQGSQFDLAIAVAILAAEGMLPPAAISTIALLGELSLDGRIQTVKGALPLIEVLESDPRITTIVIPSSNVWEASLVSSRKARVAKTVGELLEYLLGRLDLPAVEAYAPIPSDFIESTNLDSVVGQYLAKRALQIALAGGHHLLLIGPPGIGKSMLASCTPGLLPPLDPLELVEVAKVYGAFPGQRRNPRDRSRPFRAPHHTISGAGLLGGGSGIVIPGEVSLAHRGVLFLDEFPEFRKDVIEGLREPVQSGVIHLHRIGHALTLPAQFMLLAAMNPCPCGYAIKGERRCTCPFDRVRAYRRRISGAILDRMDLGVMMSAPTLNESRPAQLTHVALRESIARTRALQADREQESDPTDMKSAADALGLTEKHWFDALAERRELSYRSLHKILRVARTIADLAGESAIQLPHLQEAKSLRCPDGFGDRAL